MSYKSQLKSSISWLAWDNVMQEQMRDIIKKLKDPGTIDDLGVRQVQIACGNLFFPGTSVLLTRLRYVIMVIWLLLEVEKELRMFHKKKSNSQTLFFVSDEIHKKENLIHKHLKDAISHSDTGIIGGTLQEQPEYLSITKYYKKILVEWGILKHSLDDVLSIFEQWENPDINRNDDKQINDLDDIWILTKRTKQYFSQLKVKDFNFTLTEFEARFLQSKLEVEHKETLLFWLLSSDYELIKPLLQQKNIFVLNLEESKKNKILHIFEQMPLQLQQNVGYARTFSTLIQGATILYNYLLCQKAKKHISVREEYFQEQEKKCHASLQQWLNRWIVDFDDFQDKKDSFFLFLTKELESDTSTYNFVQKWSQYVEESIKQEEKKQIAYLVSQACEEIQKREVEKKKKKSRFNNRKRLEEWTPITSGQCINFRWTTIRRLVEDFHQSFSEKEAKGAK
jgi:hypothetical protein